MEYELPQPQVPLACGLVTVKPRLFRSSWKSTTAPLTMPRIHVGHAETPSGVVSLLGGA